MWLHTPNTASTKESLHWHHCCSSRKWSGVTLAGKKVILRPVYTKYLHCELGTEPCGLRLLGDSPAWQRVSDFPLKIPHDMAPQAALAPYDTSSPGAPSCSVPGAKPIPPSPVVTGDDRSYAPQQPFPSWKIVTMSVLSFFKQTKFLPFLFL